MNDTITIAHGLTSFDVTQDPISVFTVTNQRITLTRGKMLSPLERTCPSCEATMHVHQEHEITLKHIPLQMQPHLLKVSRKRFKCEKCNYLLMQEIPFKDPQHRITKHLRFFIEKRLAQGLTLKAVSLEFGVHPTIVKDIDKQRLERMFPTKRPDHYAQYIAIDEFLLHRGHHYATVVLDLGTGEVIWCSEGKRKQQVKDFIDDMGKEWMSHVVAVSMDMNNQYASAFAEWAPHVKIVYDLFHIVKLYNDSVITTLRRRKQNELYEKGDVEGYRLFKNMRFVLLSSQQTLAKRDRQARTNNRFLQEQYLTKGLELPPGKRLQQGGRKERLDQLLAENTDLSVAYILLEQLKLAFEETNPFSLQFGMQQWLQLARQSSTQEILTFANTIESRMEGIVNHAEHPINSGKLEGTNNLIKTIRRQAYGFRDTEYFFLKIKEATSRPKQNYQSHKFLN
jgi:transposase